MPAEVREFIIEAHPDIEAGRVPFALSLAPSQQPTEHPVDLTKVQQLNVKIERRGRFIFSRALGLTTPLGNKIIIFADTAWDYHLEREAAVVKKIHEGHDVIIAESKRPSDVQKGKSVRDTLSQHIGSESIHYSISEAMQLGVGLGRQETEDDINDTLFHESQHQSDFKYNRGILLKSVMQKSVAFGLPYIGMKGIFRIIEDPIQRSLDLWMKYAPNDPQTIRLSLIGLAISLSGTVVALLVGSIGSSIQYIHDPLEKRAREFATAALRINPIRIIHFGPKPDSAIRENKGLVELAGQELARASHASLTNPSVFPGALIPLHSWREVEKEGGAKLEYAAQAIGRAAVVTEALSLLDKRDRKAVNSFVTEYFGRRRSLSKKASEILKSLLIGNLWSKESIQQLRVIRHKTKQRGQDSEEYQELRDILLKNMTEDKIRENAEALAKTFGVSLGNRTVKVITPNDIAKTILQQTN